MMQLMGLPFLSLGIYYIRHRTDPQFLLSTVYGRLCAGGCFLSFTISINKLPTGCWLLWVFDIVPCVFTYLDLRRCPPSSQTPAPALSPLHGLWCTLFYGTLGMLAFSHRLWWIQEALHQLLARFGADIESNHSAWPREGQHIMRLAGLPLIAQGIYFFRQRQYPAFMLSSVYARLMSSLVVVAIVVVGLQDGCSSFWLILAGEALPALLCYWALRSLPPSVYEAVDLDDSRTSSAAPGGQKD